MQLLIIIYITVSSRPSLSILSSVSSLRLDSISTTARALGLGQYGLALPDVHA